MLVNIAIEGVDRLGKDTLIKGLLNRLGFMQVIHYQKPLKLEALGNSLFAYQQRSFAKMFAMLEQGGFLLNRAHLGEVVYSHRYRGYDGSYVYSLEQPTACENTLLVLLHASSWAPITDDGESFDFSAKEAEQADFWRAWERSNIKHKLSLDVTCGINFVSAERLLQVVQSAFEVLTPAETIIHVSWDEVDGKLMQVNKFAESH